QQEIILKTDHPKAGEKNASNLVHVEIKTDDSEVSVTADSVKVAIAKLKEQIKTLQAKLTPDQREKTKSALEHAVKALEGQLKKAPKDGELRGYKLEKGKPDHQLRLEVRGGKDAKAELIDKAGVGQEIRHVNVIERRVDTKSDKNQSPETKAKIEKARAEIKELARSLENSQKKLIEAQRKLSQLEGGSSTATVEIRALPKVLARVARLPENVQ